MDQDEAKYQWVMIKEGVRVLNECKAEIATFIAVFFPGGGNGAAYDCAPLWIHDGANQSRLICQVALANDARLTQPHPRLSLWQQPGEGAYVLTVDYRLGSGDLHGPINPHGIPMVSAVAICRALPRLIAAMPTELRDKPLNEYTTVGEDLTN